MKQSKRQQRLDAKKKQITIGVAQTLEEALYLAEKRGMRQIGFEGVMYIKIADNKWEMNDIVPELLQFPQYKKLYSQTISRKDVTEIMAKDVLMTVAISNLGSRNEYDLSYLIQ
jgi:hypothetical protein